MRHERKKKYEITYFVLRCAVYGGRLCNRLRVVYRWIGRGVRRGVGRVCVDGSDAVIRGYHEESYV